MGRQKRKGSEGIRVIERQCYRFVNSETCFALQPFGVWDEHDMTLKGFSSAIETVHVLIRRMIGRLAVGCSSPKKGFITVNNDKHDPDMRCKCLTGCVTKRAA
jgi:hypothetical protein